MFEDFIENNLISHNQSGSKPGDSCIKQLLSITHEICKSFDEGYETSLKNILDTYFYTCILTFYPS